MYVKGKLNGYGRAISEEGDYYVGEWKDFVKHGYGTYVKRDGTMEEGQWANGDFVDNDEWQC